MRMAPLSRDNGKLYPFQQKYYLKKPSKIHYESSLPININQLGNMVGMMSEEDLEIMEECHIYLLGLEYLSYVSITDLEIINMGIDGEVELKITYHKTEAIIRFSKEEFSQVCIGHVNKLRDSEELKTFLSTFRGLQFLRKRGRVICKVSM